MIGFLFVLLWECATVWSLSVILAIECPIYSHLGTDSTGAK